MKKIYTLIALIFCLHCSFAQQNDFECGNEYLESNQTSFINSQNTLGVDPYSYSTDLNYLNSFELITFNVFFWGINRDDGTSQEPLTKEKILEALELLNNSYNQFNICFNLVGFDYINNTDYYISPGYDVIGPRDDIFDYVENNPQYIHENAFNIYVPYRFEEGYSGIGRRKKTSFAANIATISGPVIVHEMGHNFDLYHTHNAWRDGSVYCEHVTRDTTDVAFNAGVTSLNSIAKGDHVVDTNAVPDFRIEHKYVIRDSLINLGMHPSQAPIMADTLYEKYKYVELMNNGQWQYTGSGTDCEGTPYTITSADITNFMSYNHTAVIDNFTIGQGIRIREAIQYDEYAEFIAAINENPLDLTLRNSTIDIGLEPDNSTDKIYRSPDIWIRNTNDYVPEHQNPQYNSNVSNFVYVRIVNNSCETSSGEEEVKLYWSKAAAGQTWPYNWSGNHYPNNGPIIGDIIGVDNIPVLASGEEAVLSFSWNVPNPEDYENNSNSPWHFCLLARIVSSEDPMTFLETSNLANNVRYNNNIAWKNVNVIDAGPHTSPRGRMAVGNLGGAESRVFSINFNTFLSEEGVNILEEAEVYVKLQENLWDIWADGNFASQSIQIVDEENKRIRVLEDNARLLNMDFSPEDWGLIDIEINFLTDEVSDETNYGLDITQIDTETQELMGGVGFQINRTYRDLFQAEIEESSTLAQPSPSPSLTAQSIGEPATYNWYSSNNELIYTGRQIPLSAFSDTPSKLEVIAQADGYKDYSTVAVEEIVGIENITPNPATTSILVKYKIKELNNSYISISSIAGAINNNYIIDNLEEINIDLSLSAYSPGLYILSLIQDGVVIDSKNLLIE